MEPMLNQIRDTSLKMEKSNNVINEQIQKLVVTQQCKHLIDNLESELERKKLFKKL